MIHGVAGSIGSGKSHLQLKIALEMADTKEKQLVTNFPLNRKGLEKYARHKKYKWILKCLKHGGITEIHNPSNLECLFLPEAIVCLDEAGIFLNSREFQKTSKTLLADLCQSRKFGTDLVWCAQFLEQVDMQFRMLTQYWTHANSLTVYDKKFRRPKLFYKRYYWMDANSYFQWNSSKTAKVSHIKTRFAYSFRYEGGFLNQADKLLFDCFDSFTRLDTAKGYHNIHSMYCCPIHKPNAKAISHLGHLPLFPVSPEFRNLSYSYRGLPDPELQPIYYKGILLNPDDYVSEEQYDRNNLILHNEYQPDQLDHQFENVSYF